MAIAMHVLVVANTTLPARDCIVFCRYALHLEDPPPAAGSFLGVIKSAEHPPGYPLAILAVSKVVRPIMGGGTTVPAMAMSAQVASAIAGILLTIPLYLLARRVLDRNSAFIATAIFCVLPGFVEVSSDGISDGLYWLTAVTALWFGVLAVQPSSCRRAAAYGFGAGLMCGLGYLVRPEAAVVALSIGLTLAGVIFVVWRHGRRTAIPNSGIRARLVAGLLLCVGWGLVAVPYIGLIGKITNKPAGENLFNPAPDPTYFNRQTSRPGVHMLFAIWYDPSSGENQRVWAIKGLASEYWKASHYAVACIGLLGLFSLRRRLGDPRLLLLLLYAFLQSTLLWYLAAHIGYVSQRHTILIVLVTCMFVPAGFDALAQGAIAFWKSPRFNQWADTSLVRTMRNTNPRVLVAIWCAIVIAVALPRNFKSLQVDRKGNKLAGLWMKENVPAENQIVDPFGWSEWYTTRTLREIPNPVYKPGSPDFYVVFTPNAKSPHSRLGSYEWAEVLKANRTPVFQYPEGVPDGQIEVAVYKCPQLPPPPPKTK
jgi:Dolichyl-phosphate-mannose-protein mannosyltransferase